MNKNLKQQQIDKLVEEEQGPVFLQTLADNSNRTLS